MDGGRDDAWVDWPNTNTAWHIVIIRPHWFKPFAPSMSKQLRVVVACSNVADLRFGSVYQSLQPRVSKTLLHAFLDPKKPLTTHYGAIVGLSKLGPNVIHLLILPNLGAYFRLLQPVLADTSAIKQLEAQKCHDALLVCELQNAPTTATNVMWH
jgi:hypothetical protein